MLSRNRWTTLAVAIAMCGVALTATQLPDSPVPSPAEPAVNPTLTTDKMDYQPGETAIITGSGFHANETVSVRVQHADGASEDGHGHEPFTVTTDAGGRFATTWLVDPDDSLGELFLLTADCPDLLHAEMLFTDAAMTFVRNLTDSGWYDSTGFHGASNKNYVAGNFNAVNYRNWFIFDLSGIAGTVVGARIVAANPGAGGPSQVYNLFDVSTPNASLRATNGGRTDIHSDLGTGNLYGAAFVNDPTASRLTVFFNPTGIAAIQSRLGGSIAIGGHYPSALSTNYIFAGSDGGPGSSAVQLILDVNTQSNTALAVQPATGVYGGTTTFQAVLTSSGSPVPNRPVNFIRNGVGAGIATSNAVNGMASLDNVSLIGLDAGSYSDGVFAQFNGDANFFGSSGSATLTVAQAGPTISVVGGTFSYDGSPHAALGSVTGVFGEFLAAPVFTYTDSNGVTTSTPPVNVGTYRIDASFGGNQNYLTGANSSGEIVIAPATLTVRADNKSRLYGAANPAFTASYSGFVGGDGPGVLGGTLTFTTEANSASAVGTYAITPGGLTAANYAMAFVDGTLAVDRAPLTVQAEDKSRSYGAANPAFSASYVGFVLGQDASVLGGTLAFATAATPSSPVGTYEITPGGLTSTINYDITFASGTLTVNPAALHVAAENQVRVYGEANAPLTGTLTGVQNGDNITASYNTAATAASPVGTYAIVPALSDPGSKLGNYIVTVTNGTLTVNPASLTVMADKKVKVLGAAVPALTASYNGFVNGDTPESLDAPVMLSTTATDGSPVGTYPISASGAADANYSIQFVPGTLKIDYALSLLYDATKLHKSGSTIPIKVQLSDASGANVSSSSVMLYATGVALISTSADGEVEEAGEATPDDNFRLVGPPASYMFNLHTKGLATGTYNLTFTAGSDTTVYAVPFKLR